jgi:Sulfatase
VLVDEFADCLFELRHTPMGTTSDLFVRQFGKPTLHLVEPGAIGWREMHMKARAFGKPVPDERGLVGSVVVEHEMDIQCSRCLCLNGIEEFTEVHRPMTTMELADHLSSFNVQRCKQRDRAVALVIMSSPLHLTRPHREKRLRPIQCLNLRFIIDAKHDGMFGRINVQPHDVPHFLDQQWVWRQLKRLATMRLQAEGSPNAVDSHAAHPRRLRHIPYAPVRRPARLRFQRANDHSFNLFVGNLARDSGPIKRMETVDEEFLDASLKFIEKANADSKPFFVWWNSTRMHVFTHLKKESDGKTGLGLYPDGMVEHDGHVGKLLDKLDELGIAENTIVMYSTDNGAECLSWPDGGWTPFRGEKDTNWEGGWRVPCAIRWPGVIKAGTVSNEIFSHTDMLPTLLAAAGEPDIVEKLKKSHKAGSKTFKVHIDGYNLLPYWKGEVKANPRKGFFYWSDDGDLMALRYENWKLHFMEQRSHGMSVWQEPFVPLRFPKLFNLRSDPFERADEDATLFYAKWAADRMFLLVPAQALVGEFLKTFQEFPPRQKPSSFSIDEALEKARQTEKQMAAASGGRVK